MRRSDEPDALRYDAEHAADFYDAYGDREWTRFHDGRTGQASLAIHTEYLRRFIGAGDHVLDVGAGPGRFTIPASASARSWRVRLRTGGAGTWHGASRPTAGYGSCFMRRMCLLDVLAVRG